MKCQNACKNQYYNTYFCIYICGFIVEYHATPITESGNNVVGAIITFEDISERLKTDKTLKQRIKELEQFNQLAVGRELKMVELKQEINQLLREQGEQEKYQVDE